MSICVKIMFLGVSSWIWEVILSMERRKLWISILTDCRSTTNNSNKLEQCRNSYFLFLRFESKRQKLNSTKRFVFRCPISSNSTRKRRKSEEKNYHTKATRNRTLNTKNREMYSHCWPTESKPQHIFLLEPLLLSPFVIHFLFLVMVNIIVKDD